MLRVRAQYCVLRTATVVLVVFTVVLRAAMQLRAVLRTENTVVLTACCVLLLPLDQHAGLRPHAFPVLHPHVLSSSTQVYMAILS